MKSCKLKNKVQALLCMAAICGAILNTRFSVHAADNPSNSRLRMSFAVMSDVHDDDVRFDKALKDIHNNIDPNYSALVLNGDIADEGKQSEYNNIDTVIKNDAGIIPKTVIKDIGNHEFYDYAKGENTDDDSNQFLGLSLNFEGQVHPYHDKWVSGYHFISLGSEKTYTKDMRDDCQAYLSDAQLNWFKNTLAENYRKGKPIFVFIHQPLNHSFFTTYDDCAQAIQQDAEVKAILANYPEVILFSGHTHYYLNDKDPNKKNFLPHLPGVDKGFAMVDSSSVHRPVNYGDSPAPYTPDKEKDVVGLSQGLFVQVYNDKVVIKGREFSNSTWIDGANFAVNYDNQYLNQ